MEGRDHSRRGRISCASPFDWPLLEPADAKLESGKLVSLNPVNRRRSWHKYTAVPTEKLPCGGARWRRQAARYDKRAAALTRGNDAARRQDVLAWT